MKATRKPRKTVAEIVSHLDSGVYLKGYTKAEVADFLRRHPCDLTRQQRAVIADLIEGKIKYARRGWRSRLRSLRFEAIASSILWMAKVKKNQGSKTPVDDAIEEAAMLETAEGRPVDVATMKRYYIEGRRRLGPAALRQIERLIEQYEGD